MENEKTKLIYAHVKDIRVVGKKEDNGKSPVMQGVFQFFPRALLEVGELSREGNEKYEWDGWKDLPDGAIRYGNALGRHILCEGIHGPYDRNSKRLHAAHEAWNALARLELLLMERER